MGGKGSDAPPVQPVQQDNTLAAMMPMMMSMMSQMNQPQMPMMPEVPEVETTVDVDWRAKQDELNEKMRATFNEQAKDRKGRMDTIHTSPLATEDDEDTVTSPELGGAEEKIIG